MKKLPLIFSLLIFISGSLYTQNTQGEDSKSLFEKKCSSCHPTRLPLGKNKTLDEWIATVKRMQSKMNNFLTNDEVKQLAAYLAETRGVKEDEQINEIELMESTLEQGKKMFNDISIGNNGKSCTSCHDENQNPLKKKAFLYPKFFAKVGKIINLEQKVNYCIMKYMEGESLKLGSDEMISITMYLYSLL
ncbi:hypothetical protein HZA55_04175 [Candidatus Poribacteria bacterium]|nr:hypothetical protein [Candidatus Poribacteria bacterium]